MAKINGTNLAASIVPFTTEDSFATHEAKYGKGGWREVATTTERDAITADRREAGMAVFVTEDSKVYILNADLTTWTELETGGGSVDDVQINDTSVVENKIAKITVDSTITQDSPNPVDGGAVFDALAEKQDNLPSLEDGKFLSNNGSELVWQEIPDGMTYKGQIEKPEDLPETADVGDLYNCTENGKNYIWNGEGWDELATPKIDETNLVHKTGAETIAGNKTFTSPMTIQTNNTWGLDVKSPSSGGYLYVTRGSGSSMCRFAIKAGVNGGTIGTDTNSKFSIRLNNINKMTFEKNGDIKLAANPASSSNDTQIATTKWVNDKLGSSSIYVYKGTVADLDELEETENPAVGDVYFVTEENGNFAWNGSVWGPLGSTFEIDNALSTTSENAVQNKIVTAAINAKADAVNTPNINTYAVSDGYLTVTPQAAQEGEELEPVNIIGIESDPESITGSTDTVVASSVAEDIYNKLDYIVDQKYLSGNENVEITRGFEDDNYVQLDWLQSDGTCVIDLGIIPDATSRFELKYQNERISHSSPINTYLYGCISSQLSSSGKGWALGISGSSSTTYTDLYFPSAETYTTRQSFVGADTHWHTVSVLPNMVIYDGANIFAHTTWGSATGGRSIALFGVFTGSSSDPTEWPIAPSFNGKIAYFKEYKIINNVKTLTHDFIPVRRKSDNVLGFYDKVTEAFCTNVGSGTFVAGPVYEIKISANPSENTFQLVASNSLQNNTFDRFTAPASAYNTLYNTTYGKGTTVTGNYNVAIGTNAAAHSTAGGAIAVGYNSNVSGDHAVCVGTENLVSGTNAVAIGYHTKASGIYSVNIGNGQLRDINNYSVSIGYNNRPSHSYSVYIGSDITSAGDNSVAIGHASYAATSVAIGDSASAGVNAVAVGNNAKTDLKAVDVGYKTGQTTEYQSGEGTVAVGYDTKPYNSKYNVVIGKEASVTDSNATNSVVIGQSTIASSGSAVGIGINYSSRPVTLESVAIGYGANAAGTRSISIGTDSQVSNATDYQMAFGYGAYTKGQSSISIGHDAKVSSANGSLIPGSIAIGHLSSVSAGAGSSIAIGAGAISAGSYANTVIGFNANATAGNFGVALGSHARVGADYAIQLGDGTNNEFNTLNFRSYKLVGSDGVIPYARLTTATPTDGYALKYDADNDELVWGEAGSSYTLPVATASRLGGIKVGSGLSVTNDGTLSADVQSNNFEDIGGDPYDNQALDNALTGLQDNIDNVESNLQSQIDTLSSIGQFLAIWDCDTGIARYLDNGYQYQAGNYFIIGTVAAQGQPNYMPNGASYPGSVVTTEDVKVSDMWFYDGTNWIYLANHERQIAVDHDLSLTSTNPVENQTVTGALNSKQDTLTAGRGITIQNNVISASSDSVGVPQIANVYADQLNNAEKALARQPKYSHIGFYSDICFNLNLTKEQILEKADELYIGLERFKRNMVTSHTFDPEPGEEEGKEVSYRDIPAFKLQNDHFVHTDRKMYCYRYNDGGYEDPEDDRNYKYFYSNFEYASYQDMFDDNKNIYAFYGLYTFGNRASCLNTLRNMGTFQDYEDGDEAWERYPDGDIEVFVNVNKDDSIANTYIHLRKCRQYIIDGQKKYYWADDWEDSGVNIYATSTRKIPTEYTGSLESVGRVEDLDGYEYVKRPDLNYWTFYFDNYKLSDWIEDILEPNTLQGAAWGDDSRVISWKCYWLDYPLQPVLLQDCDVMNSDGEWVRLKDVIEDGDEDTLPETIRFRYPYNSAEIWLRFSAWQKRCMYNEYNEEQDIYLELGQKKALVYAWDWNQGQAVTNKRAFGRQRNKYSGAGDNTKVCEYVQFNLYDPECVSAGKKSKSTPFKKRVVINKANGSTSIRD